jgi:predicted Zn-ribbon and HTH transcriptional regulator
MQKRRISNHARSNLIKQMSRVITSQALSEGKIKKATRCQICNKRVALQCHHEDYLNPLKVKWLCISCHFKVHIKDKKNKCEKCGASWQKRVKEPVQCPRCKRNLKKEKKNER